MKKITQVSIVYMVAALLLAQPVAQGFSLSQISTVFKDCPEMIKPYVTPQKLVNYAIIGAVSAFFIYVGIKLNSSGKSLHSSNATLRDGFKVSPETPGLTKKDKDHIRVVVNRIYVNRYEIRNFEATYVGQISACKKRSKTCQRVLRVLSEFKDAFKQYCKKTDDHAETRIIKAYNALIKELNKQ